MSSVHSTHNHDLLDPWMTAFMAGHKRPSLCARKRLPYRESKEYQEMMQGFRRCLALAYGSIEKMNFLKERIREMHNVLMNWPPTPETSRVSVSGAAVKGTGGETPVLDPKGNQYANVVERI